MENIASHFTAILGRLRQAVAGFTARHAAGPLVVMLGTQVYVQAIAPSLHAPSQHAPIPNATWLLLTERLGRLAHRFRTLCARLAAGPLPPPRPPRATPCAPLPPGHAPTPRLPAARGWINARVPEAAPCAGLLHHFLLDPQLPALVAAAPQAGRLLRPLCRALAIDLPEWLRLPPRPAKTKPPERRAASTRSPRPPPAAPSPHRALPVWYPSPPRLRNNRP